MRSKSRPRIPIRAPFCRPRLCCFSGRHSCKIARACAVKQRLTFQAPVGFLSPCGCAVKQVLRTNYPQSSSKYRSYLAAAGRRKQKIPRVEMSFLNLPSLRGCVMIMVVAQTITFIYVHTRTYIVLIACCTLHTISTPPC